MHFDAEALLRRERQPGEEAFGPLPLGSQEQVQPPRADRDEAALQVVWMDGRLHGLGPCTEPLPAP